MNKPNYYNAVEKIVGENILLGGSADGPISEILFPPETDKPTEEAIQVKLAELQAEYDAQEYARKRKVEYDALNQFELMTDDAANGTTTHADAINAIKAKYPKG